MAMTIPVEEIKIDVPWGIISGKWWGPKYIRPIVCLHGWQDNAGTFDTLIPLLPQHLSYLALDLPGHGTSSWLPDGVIYHASDFPNLLFMIMNHYKWKKISLLGHSMGSRHISFIFATVFNELVDLAIGLDALKPFVESPVKVIQSIRRKVPAYITADERNRDENEPPSYTYDDIVKKLHVGTSQSVDLEHCKYLLNRNSQKSKKDPSKFYFSRDNRLKSFEIGFYTEELNLILAREIKCPYLFIKSLNSEYEEERHYNECIEVLKTNPNFEIYEVEGTHHVHLNDPTKVSGIISNFINKYRPAQIKSKI